MVLSFITRMMYSTVKRKSTRSFKHPRAPSRAISPYNVNAGPCKDHMTLFLFQKITEPYLEKILKFSDHENAFQADQCRNMSAECLHPTDKYVIRCSLYKIHNYISPRKCSRINEILFYRIIPTNNLSRT